MPPPFRKMKNKNLKMKIDNFDNFELPLFLGEKGVGGPCPPPPIWATLNSHYSLGKRGVGGPCPPPPPMGKL